MKRWRPLIWILLSLACFIGAYYFWRLGDKWQKQKPAGTAAPATSNAASPTASTRLTSSVQKRVSTAPVIPPLHPLTNSVVRHSTNFPYRLSNTEQSIGQLVHNSKAILLENALIDSSKPIDLAIPDSLRAHGDPGAYIVQADGQIDNAFRARLSAAGLNIVSYIPNNAYLVTGTAAQVVPFGSAAYPWEPYYKVKSALMPAALAGQPVSAINVAVLPGALDKTEAALQSLGVTIASQSPSPFGTELNVQNVNSLAAVASLTGVMEIEPSSPRTVMNDLTRVILGETPDVYVPTNYLGLTGANVIVDVNDSWEPTNGSFSPTTTINPDLTNILQNALFANGIMDQVGHATHVAGIIGANGVHSPTNIVGSPPDSDCRGKAPAANIFPLPLMTGLTDAQLQEIAAQSNALISNNSWGYGSTSYDLAAASYDQAVRDSIPGQTGSQSLIYVFAAGNNGGGDGNGDGVGGAADSLSSPGVSKDVITVGASMLPRNITNQTYVCDACDATVGCSTNEPWLADTSSSNLITDFSSRGNVGIGVEGQYGRFKPDVVAPGAMVVSTRSMTWDTNAYYNPINDDVMEFDDDTVISNLFNYSFFIPCDTAEVTVQVTSVSPTNVPLVIYANNNGFPTTSSFIAVGTNTLTLNAPNPLSPTDVEWYFSIGNPTNIPVTYDIVVQIITTNSLGNYFDVLASTNLNGGLLDTNGNGPYYRYESGTSMATPAVSGVLALMEDFFTNRLGYNPSPALMKAMLINGARSINEQYDFLVQSSINYQGWGLVNITNSLPAAITNAFNQPTPMFYADQSVNNALATGDSQTYTLQVTNSTAQSAPLRVTLVWTDPPGNPAASLKLVNNLELIVTNTDGGPTNPVVFFGNDFDSGNIFTSQWDGDTNNIPFDTINNVQNVYIPQPLGTNYTITVFAKDVNVNAVTANTNAIVQDYALVISSDNGEISNAFVMSSAPAVIPNKYAADVTTVTNEFPNSSTVSGGLLLNQLVGASSPLQGTNTLSLGAVNQDQWSPNGQITLGVSNQWHFYVITNTVGTNAQAFTNAAFVTFLPSELSVPPTGVDAPNASDATRPQADIDLYVARGPTAYLLTNLDPATVAGADKSLGRGGEELVIYSNAQPNEVFYIGVKSEDQEAAIYAFAGLFSLNPFSTLEDGVETVQAINVPTIIGAATPSVPSTAFTLGIAVQPIAIRRAVVTNSITDQEFGDLVGTLQHNQISVVLNNHTFGNGATNQFLIYEDNGEGDIQFSRKSDGPGSLTSLIGQQGFGLWTLSEVNNGAFNTGQVNNVSIRLEPQSNGTNAITATIPPGGIFYDFIDVPPNATNLTICVSYDPSDPTPEPLDLYVKFGALPTPTFGGFDYFEVINPPGNCLSIGETSLPPLKAGRYYFGILNPPNNSTQTVDISWTFGLNVAGANPVPIVSTNAPISLLEDAVTNSSIFITNQQDIVSVNVGVVLTDPRVSDLDLTLISPTGQRILLFENRGGSSATNMGHLNITTNFFGNTVPGGANANTNILAPVPNQGVLVINYDMFTIPDQMDVYYDGADIFHSGYVSGIGTFTIPYGPGADNFIQIVMNQGNNPVSTTAWEYTPSITTEDFTYLTFTDDTNLTQTPIKYAIPPYDSADSATNINLSDFSLATNRDYISTPASPTNIIFDAFGGWSVTTNNVFIHTNYFAGTNLLSMATNFVSVVTDPNTAANGTNYLALANGSISRVIPVTPQRNYTITYLYRGPDIAGWWRGENNASDSSDPETLGNNGDLIGRFDFPAGEVGQAFAMEDAGTEFEFAGTNTYVQIPQSPSLNVGATGSGLTVEGWINPTNIDFQQPLVEWLAHVPTNTIVNGQPVTNLVIEAGPFLNRANGHYYYLLGQTNWTTSELWANSLGGHLVEVDDANEEQFVYDTFARYGLSNHTMWIGLTNNAPVSSNFVWSTGSSNLVYANWGLSEPTNCNVPGYVAILGPTNALPGLWDVLDNNGVDCNGTTNAPFGVVEVDQIQTNGVQLWISVTNSVTNNVLTGNGRLYANIMDTNNQPHEIFSAPGLIQSNVFQHVALTYNTNTGVAELFYNGTNVATTNLGVFVPNTGGDVLLGKDMSLVTNNFFWGEMDEMSIYGRYLSDAEIAAIYNISASTTNRNIGKFDPAITPAESLAEAQAVFGNQTNLLYGLNGSWQVQGFNFQAQSNTLPVQITGIEPGVLLDSFFLSEKPLGNLYYLPEQPLNVLVGSNAFGNWTLEIRDSRTGDIVTNANLISWELQFILQSNTPIPTVVSPQSPSTNTIPPGEIAYYVINVPDWANDATNILVSSVDSGGNPAPVSMLFNQTVQPDTGNPGDFIFVNNANTGSATIQANPPTLPPLVPGQSYYLAVTNPGPATATVVVEVDFNITTLQNGVPVTSGFTTNAADFERPFVFYVTGTNSIEATFQLLQMTGNADLVLRKGLPIPSLLSSDYGSFGGSNSDETIYVLTNSLPVPLSVGPWYLDVVKRQMFSDTGTNQFAMRYSILAKVITNAPTIIDITNRVPFTFTAGPGAALTNFFRFSSNNFNGVISTNLGLRFELYNQTGNGDLTVQTNFPPMAPPFFQSSRLPANDAELITIQTNSSLTNLMTDWYLGVPNNEIHPITYTILGVIDTNVFPSFPTAEGAGSATRGGAFGTNVYHVTNLGDSGAGTLRAAVTSTNGGGTVVFDTSGTINLLSPLYITNSGYTIAGQTAPGGNGVTITGGPVYVQDVSDIVIRYLRFRPGSSSIDFNGSFETPTNSQTYFAGQTFGGWAVLTGSVDDVTRSGGGWLAADGNHSIDMNGFTAGAISRTVPTVAGTKYDLRFAYAGNPDDPNTSSIKTMDVLWNGTVVGTTAFAIAGHSDTNMGWTYTNLTVVGTGSDVLEFASTTTTGLVQFGPTLDAVSLTAGIPGPAMQITNSFNVVIDHVSAGLASDDLVSVLNSSNVTVQWSVLADSENQTSPLEGGSEVRYGSGDVTLHHNLYSDNYSGNPTIGEDVTLDFVNNVIYNWGLFAGLSTNDIVDNPGGVTNYLNYAGNYLIAGTNSDLTNGAFWGSSTNTFIFQTNNFLDTNLNTVLDGSDTGWGAFSNQFTAFTAPFQIQPTAPDEAFIAYERVLDFAGTSMAQRDATDIGTVEQVRFFGGTNATPALLSGMSAWWKAENNPNDSVGANNGTWNGTTAYAPGEVGNAFDFDGASWVQVPDGPDLRFTNQMSEEAWIYMYDYSGNPNNDICDKFAAASLQANSYGLAVEGTSAPTHRGYFNISDTTITGHVVFTPNAIPLNQWVHLCGTYDGTTQKIYLNGVLVASQPLSVTINPGTQPLSIGGSINGSVYAFMHGRIDEVSLYKRALTDCEVAAIYNAGPAGKQSLLSGSGPGGTGSPVPPYMNTSGDGIPDFWKITLGEPLTNFDANLLGSDGYTYLEEYLNWLGSPHALTLTNTTTNVDLYVLSGKTGNLTFGVQNGTNGTVYLTNNLTCEDPASADTIAVFTPTNSFNGSPTNGGFASFSYMVTNMDTVAYFGPVTVSVFVSSVPITNASVFSFPNPTNIEMNPNTTLLVTNVAIPTNGVTYYLTNSPPWVTINTNTGVITLSPTNGPSTNIITTVATDTNVPPDVLSNTFTVIVNGPPVFILNPPPNLTNGIGVPITVTNAATDPDMPPSDLFYQLLVPPSPTNAVIGTNTGIITWTPLPSQLGSNEFETVVTDTNGLSATNIFYIVVVPAAAPYAFTQPAQGVLATLAQLNGMATPNGAPSMAWFEWGTNTLYGNTTPAVNVGGGFNVVYVKHNLGGLTPNLAYHYRLVVSNALAVVTGFDQIFDEANLVVWGANFLQQSQPPVVNNLTAIAGAYDHSLALQNNRTVVAWGDNTFSQVNVPPGLSGVLAVAGGQYSSMALKTGGTVAAWGGNIFAVTNVPASVTNVIMIAGGTDAGMALQGSGNVVAWGSSFSGETNLPSSVTNSDIVEVSSGNYHGLAIKNDGTVIAWGDNSAGQTAVPPGLTNVVQVSGGNFHSLALKSDGTVVSWGDNSDGQTNVPAGLSNVVAVAAGGFHSMALKSDGTIVGWGDDSEGQTSFPPGLTNAVAIAAGNFHSLALTPLSLASITGPIILTTTNGAPQTNTILAGQTLYYQVNVPGNADFSTNAFGTLGGNLNMFFTTNTPPTITNLNDVLLITNLPSGSSTLSTNGAPHFADDTTYYLGLENTNSFAVSVGVDVTFHFVMTTVPSTNTVPISIVATNISGKFGFLLTWYAPSNDLFEVQWSPGASPTTWTTFTNPLPVTYDVAAYTNNPANTLFEFFDDGSQTGGFGPTRFYQVILLNGSATAPPSPLSAGVGQTNGLPAGDTAFYQVNVPSGALFATNSLLSAQGGNLNVWFSTNAPPTISNPNDSLLISNASSGSSVLTTNGSPQLVGGGTYYLGVQNTNTSSVVYGIEVNFGFIAPTNAAPLTNTIPISSITRTNIGGSNAFLLVWFAPSNDLFMVQWSSNLFAPWNTFTNIVGYDPSAPNVNATNTQFDFIDDGSETGGLTPGRFYQLILLNGASPSSPSAIPLVNGVPLVYTTAAGSTNYFSFNITQTNPAVLFELYNLSTNGLLILDESNLPVTPPYLATSAGGIPSTNYQQIVLRTNTTGPTNLNAISWFLGVPNQNSTSLTYTIRAVLPTNGMLVSGLPIGTTVTQSGGTNLQLAWGPTVNGEMYEIRTNGNLASPNWGALTDVTASGTSLSFTNAIPAGSPPLFYWVVQIP